MFDFEKGNRVGFPEESVVHTQLRQYLVCAGPDRTLRGPESDNVEANYENKTRGQNDAMKLLFMLEFTFT